MTVSELIQQLQKMPGHLPVLVPSFDSLGYMEEASSLCKLEIFPTVQNHFARINTAQPQDPTLNTYHEENCIRMGPTIEAVYIDTQE